MPTKSLNAQAKSPLLPDDLFNFQDGPAILGTRGPDVLTGTNRGEVLNGFGGNDAISGGAGNDRLFGREGDDVLAGGAGNDLLDGGAGNDRFIIRKGTGIDTIANFEAGDRIDLSDFDFASASDVLNAFKQVGQNLVLDLGNGDKLVIKHAKLADLDPKQFVVSDEATGPSSSKTPYIQGVDPHISTVSLLTTGDTVGVKSDGVTPWKMAGIPDGLGAFDNGDGTFTVLMSHELRETAGAVRDHGATGAFVSKLIIDKETLQVTDAGDLIQNVFLYDKANNSFFDPLADGNPATTSAISRICSSDLAETTAFYNPETGLGYNGGRIFLNGEESGIEGRAFAHFASGVHEGKSYELPWIGKFSHENVVANAYTGDKTVVASLDDGTNGQVYFYFGDKKATGSDLDKAGLTGGSLYGLKVAEFTDETSAANPLGTDGASSFSLVDLGNVAGKTGAELDAASEAAGVSSFLRPEDGAWDVIDHNRFYFVTTNAFGQPSRLWAADFVDATDPTKGGTVKLLLDGTEGQQMLDNLTVTKDGRVLLQEDVGNNAHLGKIWEYDPKTDQLTLLAQHDPARFVPGGANFITQDEESSGIIDISDILGSTGRSAYLLDVQSHKALGGELVEDGQLLVMYQDHI